MVDTLERPYVYLDRSLGSYDCIVYNSRTHTFEIKDVTELRSAHPDVNKHYVVNVNTALHSISNNYKELIGDLYPQALKQARATIYRFEGLIGYTLDLSDSKLQVTNVTIGDNESHDWKDLIEITGVRTRNDCSKHYCAPLSVLKSNSELLRIMVEQTYED